MLKWEMAEAVGYEPITTFWTDFCIAEVFGVQSIIETYERAFAEWKDDYKYLTELVMVLNHKIWQWYELGDKERAGIYDQLWREADSYAIGNLTGEEAAYFYQTTN